MVLPPNGKIGFVEVKATGEKPRLLQFSRHRLLRRLGFLVYVLDDAEQIGGMLDEIQNPMGISKICSGVHQDTPRSRYLLRLRAQAFSITLTAIADLLFDSSRSIKCWSSHPCEWRGYKWTAEADK